MRSEGNEDKRRRNIRKHGVDFLDMTQLFDGRPTFTYRSPREGEDRWGTVGLVEGKFYLVVWTKREERTRVVAAYRADGWEIREYHKLHGESG